MTIEWTETMQPPPPGVRAATIADILAAIAANPDLARAVDAARIPAMLRAEERAARAESALASRERERLEARTECDRTAVHAVELFAEVERLTRERDEAHRQIEGAAALERDLSAARRERDAMAKVMDAAEAWDRAARKIGVWDGASARHLRRTLTAYRAAARR